MRRVGLSDGGPRILHTGAAGQQRSRLLIIGELMGTGAELGRAAHADSSHAGDLR
jgi:hypothetical protein